MRLRFRQKKGVQVIDEEFQPHETIGKLLDSLYRLTGISPMKLRIKTGYPPTSLVITNPKTQTFEDFHLVHGDILLLEPLEHPVVENNQSSMPHPKMIPPSHVENTHVENTYLENTHIEHPQPRKEKELMSSSFVKSTLSNLFSPPPLPTLTPSNRNRTQPLASNSDSDNNHVVPRVVDADNSCLFTSISYLLEHKKSSAISSRLRRVVADAILKNPEKYSTAILGRDPKDYVRWITRDESWGGAIETQILSQHYGTAIFVFDINNLRIERYGDTTYTKKIFLMYDGIHYDPLVLADETYPVDFDTKVFAVDDCEVEDKAFDLVRQLHQDKKFVDTGNFSLRCLVCNTGLTGQREAQDHAKKTGHRNFSQY